MAELSVETVKAIITYANKNVNLEICYSQSTPRIDQLQTYHCSIEKQPNFGKYAFLRRWLYVIPVYAPRLLPNYGPRVGKSGLKATSPVMSMFSWPWKRQIAILIFVQLFEFILCLLQSMHTKGENSTGRCINSPCFQLVDRRNSVWLPTSLDRYPVSQLFINNRITIVSIGIKQSVTNIKCARRMPINSTQVWLKILWMSETFYWPVAWYVTLCFRLNTLIWKEKTTDIHCMFILSTLS